MKAYLAVTATLFGLVAAVHVWRAIVEPTARDPWFMALAVVAAFLCVWGARLLSAMRSQGGSNGP